MQIRHAQPDPPLLAAQQRRKDKRLNHPLVPHLAVVRLAPHTDLQLRVVGKIEGRLLFRARKFSQSPSVAFTIPPFPRARSSKTPDLVRNDENGREERRVRGNGKEKGRKAYLEREKDRKPRDHVGALGAHRDGIRAQLDAAVEFGLEVAG